MPVFIDARLPVHVPPAGAALPDAALPNSALTDALLIEAEGPDDAARPGAPAVARFRPDPAAHAAGCACCAGQGPAAAALTRLFLARARGTAPLFARVRVHAATEAGRAAILNALENDAMVAGRYRLG